MLEPRGAGGEAGETACRKQAIRSVATQELSHSANAPAGKHQASARARLRLLQRGDVAHPHSVRRRQAGREEQGAAGAQVQRSEAVTRIVDAEQVLF